MKDANLGYLESNNNYCSLTRQTRFADKNSSFLTEFQYLYSHLRGRTGARRTYANFGSLPFAKSAGWLLDIRTPNYIPNRYSNSKEKKKKYLFDEEKKREREARRFADLFSWQSLHQSLNRDMIVDNTIKSWKKQSIFLSRRLPHWFRTPMHESIGRQIVGARNRGILVIIPRICRKFRKIDTRTCGGRDMYSLHGGQSLSLCLINEAISSLGRERIFFHISLRLSAPPPHAVRYTRHWIQLFLIPDSATCVKSRIASTPRCRNHGRRFSRENQSHLQKSFEDSTEPWLQARPPIRTVHS